MVKMDFLNNNNLQIIVFRKLFKVAQKNGLTASQWAEKSNIQQADLSKVMNGKKGIIEEKFQRLLDCIGVNQKQLDEIVKESKKDELRIYYNDEVEQSTPPTSLEDMDLDSEDLLKVLYKKDGLKEPNEDDLREILNFIKFKAGR